MRTAIHRTAICRSLLTALATLPIAACATAPEFGAEPRLVDAATGKDVAIADAAAALAGYDVVFLGEQHNHPPVHRTHLALLEALLQERRDLAISMEMFDRSQQVVLSQYLDGQLDEPQMLAMVSTWKDYYRDYRPFVELAKNQGLPVIAANVPRSLVRKVSREGLEAAEGEPYMPDTVDLTRGDYFLRCAEAMGMPVEDDGEADELLERLYTAQRVWDSAMAESIARHFEDAAVAFRKPLVAHIAGAVHVGGGLGTVQVLAGLRPDLVSAVVDVVSVPARDVPSHRITPDPKAAFVLIVPERDMLDMDSGRIHGRKKSAEEAPPEAAEGSEAPAPPVQPMPESQPATASQPATTSQPASTSRPTTASQPG